MAACGPEVRGGNPCQTTTKWFVGFYSVPENSAGAFWSECIQGAILNHASWLLPITLSGSRISSSHEFVNLLVYLCEKFGALNRRINETRSSKNRPEQLSQLLPPRFSILPIIWLSGLSLNRASRTRTIMDNSQDASSSSVVCRSYAIRKSFQELFLKL